MTKDKTPSMTVAEFRAQAGLKPIADERTKPRSEPPKPNKFHAVRTEVAGRVYDSKREAAYAQKLQQQKLDGEISGWIPQVSLPVSPDSSTRYVLDFLVINLDGGIEFIDTKGRDTPISKQKRKQILDNYGLIIDLK